MSSNRLLPYQFAPGLDASPTRIEQSLLELAKLYDDVPADLVRRRWSPSPLLWGFSPPSVGVNGSPYLEEYNYSFSGTNPISHSQLTNTYRTKSTQVDGITFEDYPISGGLLTWEVTMLASHPMIIGSFVVMAGLLTPELSNYLNSWRYGVVPPAGHSFAQPTQDFTLQVCISDGWDLENRKKLRQESLTYKMRSDAFDFSPAGVPSAGSDPTKPPFPSDALRHPVNWNGFAVMADALVLVPVGARIVFQWTIPRYPEANNSTWGLDPTKGNTWNLRALTYSPTH